MADDLVKGEWSKSKFLDMLKEYPETILKINDEKVKKLTEQLNSDDEVNLFKEEISKKKLNSSLEYNSNKKIIFSYDMGATDKNPVALMSDETQSDIEELDYNIENITEKPKIKVGKTIWKGIKHFGKAFLKEGWNADITDFYDGVVEELSDFTLLVGETYKSDSRFRNNFDGVYSKIIGNSDEEYSKIINNILDNCIIKKTSNTGINKDNQIDKQGNIESTVYNKLNEVKSLLSISDAVIDSNISDIDENNLYIFPNDNTLVDRFIITNIMNIKKYNVIINFIDYLVNKWRYNDLVEQMKKNKKAIKYPEALSIFIKNINNIINTDKEDISRNIKTILLYRKMRDDYTLDKALSFMLYTIYLAKANFDQNLFSDKSNEKLDLKILFGLKNNIKKMNEYIKKTDPSFEYSINEKKWDILIKNTDKLSSVDTSLNVFLNNISENKYFSIKEFAMEFIRFIKNSDKLDDYIKDGYIIKITKTAKDNTTKTQPKEKQTNKYKDDRWYGK